MGGGGLVVILLVSDEHRMLWELYCTKRCSFVEKARDLLVSTNNTGHWGKID